VPRLRITSDGAGMADVPARYFYLSYPRPRPLPPVAGLDVSDPPDEWVREFYLDLTAAVREHAVSPPSVRPGFLDLAAAPGADSGTARTEALATAEVFIPLLSPEYVRMSWPGREWASFERRVLATGATEPHQRYMPVLWSPLPSGESAPGLREALSLAPVDAAGPYAENGLRALLRLAPHRGLYRQIVNTLATRVVMLASRAPLDPSPAPDPADCDSAITWETRGPAFALAIAGGPDSPGDDWHPFGSRHEMAGAPVLEYARAVVERRGFAVLLGELEKSADLFQRVPGVVLVDPRCAVQPAELDAFRTVVSELPSWVLPILLIDQDDPLRATEMRTFTMTTYKAYKSYPDTVQRGLRGVSSLRELLTFMPFVVSQAEREYLRHGTVHRSTSRPTFRPRPAAGESTPAPVKETPHGRDSA
jgi:hypothetical protein